MPFLMTEAFALIFIVLIGLWLMPAVFIRSLSLQGHIERPLQAVQKIIERPLGLGLGSAGPAANRTHDGCVFLEENADISWASGSPDLCIFSGVVQVQPNNRVCDCAFLPENWYLQMGVEGGVISFCFFAALTLLILMRLWKKKDDVIFFSFLAISIAAFFLHAWEDSAVAYTIWLMAASSLPQKTS
jgi:hypothetical protein